MAEIQPVSQHRIAVEDLPASTIINNLSVNSVYKLYKNVSSKDTYCYIKITTKTPITLPGETDPYDCNITGPAVYLEYDANGKLVTGEIGIREIKNLISNSTHVASDNWRIYTSSVSEYNDMVDEVINYMNYVEPDLNHLSLTSKHDGSTVYIQSLTITATHPDFEYSYDGITWTPWSYTTISGAQYTHTFSTITLNFNERIYIRSHATTLSMGASLDYNTQFCMTGRIAAAGNIQSLTNYSEIVSPYSYYNLFYNCSSLISAPELPALTLGAYCYRQMFYGCTSLEKPPMLPANLLKSSCYNRMFYGCASLRTAPKLPAMALKTSCYDTMFYGCTSLEVAPDLPARKIASTCYSSMFRGCTFLRTAPKLPATTLEVNCYQQMFQECTSLRDVPELPALILAQNCYYLMFSGCTKIKEAPTLRASTLAKSCYYQMFSGCTSLIKCADIQRATTLSTSCCAYMYNGCTSLDNAITPNINSWTSSYFTNWLTNVASTGTLYKPDTLTNIPTSSGSGCPTGWSTATNFTTVKVSAKGNGNTQIRYKLNNSIVQVNEGQEKVVTVNESDDFSVSTNSSNNIIKINDTCSIIGTANTEQFHHLQYSDIVGATITCTLISSMNPLCFTSRRTDNIGATISMTHNGTNQSTTQPVIYISTDNGQTYRVWDYSTITLNNPGDFVYMVGLNTTISSSSSNYSTFIANYIEASGNLNSLIGFSDSLGTYCYFRLFSNNNNLFSAPELPALTLGTYCYSYMFYGCVRLETPPELPAEVLTNYCYSYMFRDCSNLHTSPELPADELATYCYQGMFYGCTRLVTPPELPATTLTNYCYQYMFYGCVRLETPPELPATTLATNCYSNMFRDCSALITAPELPATKLSSNCYATMFYSCSSLLSTPVLPATTLATSCYSNMFRNCTSLTIVPELPATTLIGSCYQRMFQDCTSLSSPAELPAPTPTASSCYQYMFYGCSLMNHIIVGATSWSTSAASNWVNGVAASGTFEKPSRTSIATGVNGIPSGWTVVNL